MNRNPIKIMLHKDYLYGYQYSENALQRSEIFITISMRVD